MIYNLNNQEERNLYAEGNNKPSYPFSEGDDYYTIEDGQVVWSCWDDVSEELHTPDKKYFASEKEAQKELKLITLLEELNDQANELISFGDSKEKAQGYGMKSVTESVSELLEIINKLK